MECWNVYLYDSGRRVQADQENDSVKMKLFFQTSSLIEVKNFETILSKYKRLVANAIMIMGFILYSCEDTQTENFDGIDASVVINEINYNSSDSFDPEDWVELHNPTNETIAIGLWEFKDDNDDHVFTLSENMVLSPGQYLVLCKDADVFSELFPNVSNFVGDLGFGLSASGDLVRLFDSNGSMVDIVEYDDDDPWPTLADGSGPTLELKHPSLDNSLWENWSASDGNGTPGAMNSTYDGDE